MSQNLKESNIASEVVETTTKSIIIELIMFFTYAFFAANWIAGSTLTPQIMGFFNLKDFTSATFISNAITIAKVIGNFMAAFVLRKLFLKRSIALGSFLMMIPQEMDDMNPGKLTAVMGLFWLVSYVIETIMFFIIGRIIDEIGYVAGLNFALVLSLTFLIGSFLLPETNKEVKNNNN